jgi:hypothetical protein
LTYSSQLTAETQRGRAATEARNISRKDAKAAKKVNKMFSELDVLRVLAGGISNKDLLDLREFFSIALQSSQRKKRISEFEICTLSVLRASAVNHTNIRRSKNHGI